jgi:hypothetical protein
MQLSVTVDSIWNAFCDTLPPDLRPAAEALAMRVSLVPVPGVPWSEVFKNEVTLAAPALFVAAMPRATHAMVVRAVTAHMLAVVDAFATDRMLDGQAESSPELLRLLGCVRACRDRAMRDLAGRTRSPYRDAETAALAAINTERILLEHGLPLAFSDYTQLSLAKQAVAFPASMALAGCAGWDGRRILAVKRVLEGIVLGLQFHDDVVDWEDDWRHGRSWAVSLSRRHSARAGLPAGPPPSLELVRRQVHESGVLATMMDMARRRYREAARLAVALGVPRLARWALEQEVTMTQLALHEAQNAGYVVRERQLSQWALAVLG